MRNLSFYRFFALARCSVFVFVYRFRLRSVQFAFKFFSFDTESCGLNSFIIVTKLAFFIGAVRLLGGLQRNNDLTTTSNNGAAVGVSNLVVSGASTFTLKDSNGYTLGAEVPLAPSTVLGVNYTRMNYEGTLGQSTNLGKMAVSVRFGLSKNTFLYTGASFATGDLKDYISQQTVVQAGLRTAF